MYNVVEIFLPNYTMMILLLKSCKFQEHSSKKNSTTIRTLSCCYVKNNQVCSNNIPWLRWWYSILCKLHHISGQESFTSSLLSFIHSCKLYVMSALVGLQFAQCSEKRRYRSRTLKNKQAERSSVGVAAALLFFNIWCARRTPSSNSSKQTSIQSSLGLSLVLVS